MQSSEQPSGYPTTQPTSLPSVQPSVRPSSQPLKQPSAQPSGSPSQQSFAQHSHSPTPQPNVQPSRLPTSQVTGEWVSAIDGNSTGTLVAAVGDAVWACGTSSAFDRGSFCTNMDVSTGAQNVRFPFRWNRITSTVQSYVRTEVMTSGVTNTDSFVQSDIASCTIETDKLTFSAQTFSDTIFESGCYIPFAEKVLYVGTTKPTYSSVNIMDPFSGTVRSFIYTSPIMPTISLLHVISPPNFIGGFIAGTCMNEALQNNIFVGMVRTDSGLMTGMYLTPKKGTILNSAELVNDMALEPLGPDSFIAGGLQLSDGTGMHAYLVRLNSLYRRFIYGMLYIVVDPSVANRRILTDEHTLSSTVQGLVLVEPSLYLLVNVQETLSIGVKNSVSVLKIDSVTGSVVQQVHIYAYNASIWCSDISAVQSSLVLACAVQNAHNTAHSMVLSVNRELTFSKLPGGFIRLEQDLFRAEPVMFKSTLLPLTMTRDDKVVSSYTFNTVDGYPTIQPSKTPTSLPSSPPSSAPSGQPNSSPTAAPSVSPQPTSQPSSSGPTNTYKPTVEPSVHPTARPTVDPTTRPSCKPSVTPTVRPSRSPTTRPSTKPSATPSSSRPTATPSIRPTRNPAIRSTSTPTSAPSVTLTEEATSQQIKARRYRARESQILGYAVGGMFGLFCLYLLCSWCINKSHKVKRDKKRVRDMVAQDLPGKPRYPIFTAVVGLCCAMENVTEEETTQVPVAPTTAVTTAVPAPAKADTNISSTYTGQGANIDGPAVFVDLEANIQTSTTSAPEKVQISETKVPVDSAQTEERNEVILPQVAPAEVILSQADGEISDLSEASSISDESADGSDSHSDAEESEEKEDDADVVLSEESAVQSSEGHNHTAESEAEPSDDSDVVYTLSSDDESNNPAGGQSLTIIESMPLK